MTHIYLVRHGQSEGNLRRAFLGHYDLDLTEQGHRQAEKTAEFLSDVKADVIYSSDLKRAYSTALHTANKKGMDIIKNENFREIFAGEWENRLFDDLIVEYGEGYRLFREDIGHAHPTGGESVAELWVRVMAELRKIARENDGKTVLVFTHATPIRSIKAALDGLTLDEMQRIPWPSNASVTHVVADGDGLRVVEYSRDDFMGDCLTTLPKTV